MKKKYYTVNFSMIVLISFSKIKSSNLSASSNITNLQRSKENSLYWIKCDILPGLPIKMCTPLLT